MYFSTFSNVLDPTESNLSSNLAKITFAYAKTPIFCIRTLCAMEELLERFRDSWIFVMYNFRAGSITSSLKGGIRSASGVSPAFTRNRCL